MLLKTPTRGRHCSRKCLWGSFLPLFRTQNNFPSLFSLYIFDTEELTHYKCYLMHNFCKIHINLLRDYYFTWRQCSDFALSFWHWYRAPWLGRSMSPVYMKGFLKDVTKPKCCISEKWEELHPSHLCFDTALYWTDTENSIKVNWKYEADILLSA